MFKTYQMSFWSFFRRIFHKQKQAPPKRLSQAEQKGLNGELFVHSILSQLPNEYIVLDDVVLKTSHGTTQIDHVVVSKYAVFAIETKNYRGEIYGDDDRQEWTQIILTDVVFWKKWYKTYTYVTKNHFYNPVKQSLSHVYAIQKLLVGMPFIKVVPIVVFAGNVVLNNVTSQYHVIFPDQLLPTIRSYSIPYISEASLYSIANCIAQNDVKLFMDNEAHARNVDAARQNYYNKIASGKCPQCGGDLVLRNGKYGSFHGCSNYPKCKFTTH